ncbi:MAG: BMP family ABC transporter substrate-binding protein [Ruminococcaceae bacterium]|nr:BMP family ABC transporter substrate-binding protein [Oscillospiraceae bacterium]MBQ6873545.1 BMP family ABC transporter substrate-binding protein [Clostridia bacterium]
MKKFLAILLAVVLCLSLAACGGNGGEDKTKGMSESPIDAVALNVDYTVPAEFKIGFICLHDENSTYDLNFLNAVDKIQEELKLADSQVIVKTNVPEGNECYEAAKDLVNQGCSVVFANSFGHEDYMIKAAKEFPKVQFCHATGTKAHTEGLDNYHNAFASIYQGRYLAGIAAGLKLNEMIEAGKFTAEEAKIGYVGAFTYAEVISGYTSFYLGAKSVCPTVTMDVQFTGSWYDATEEKNAAEALIAKDCKLISQHADSMGAPGACEAAGVPNVSYNGSTYDSCFNTFIISSAINWAPYYNYIIGQAVKGEKIAADWCGGIKEGSVVLTGINQDVAAEGTADAIKKAVADFNAGTLNVFDAKNFTVGGKALDSYKADVDTDAAFEADTEVIADGYFHESEYRSAPYFDLRIDGITLLNEKF